MDDNCLKGEGIMRKRLLSMLLCGALVSTSLMGCGSKTNTTDPAPAANAKTEAGATEAPAPQTAEPAGGGTTGTNTFVDGGTEMALDLPGASCKLLYGNGGQMERIPSG